MTEKTYTVELTKAELKAIRRAISECEGDEPGKNIPYGTAYDKIEAAIQQAIVDTIKGVG